MWAAQAVALRRPEAIRYRAWKRSRLRGWAACREARRKSSRLWPQRAICTRTIGLLRRRLRGRAVVPAYPTGTTQNGNSWSLHDSGLVAGTIPNAGSSTTPPLMDGDLNVGEASGTVTACQFVASNEVDLGTNSLSHHVNVYGDGTTAATFEEDLTSGDCTLGGGNDTDLQN